MIFYFKNLKTSKLNKGPACRQAGMTYVELIVVLSIFAVLSGLAIFNYGGFQAKVDIQNLANDIALKIVEAQKSSVSGLMPPLAQQGSIQDPLTWKPSYGLYFNSSTAPDPDNNGVPFNKEFIYFTDLDQSSDLLDPDCVGSSECLDKINITKNNRVSRLDVFYQGSETPYCLNDLTLIFKRPSSGARIFSEGSELGSGASIVSYVQITLVSPNGTKALIKAYPSGRVQIDSAVSQSGGLMPLCVISEES